MYLSKQTGQQRYVILTFYYIIRRISHRCLPFNNKFLLFLYNTIYYKWHRNQLWRRWWSLDPRFIFIAEFYLGKKEPNCVKRTLPARVHQLLVVCPYSRRPRLTFNVIFYVRVQVPNNVLLLLLYDPNVLTTRLGLCFLVKYTDNSFG